MEGDAPQFLIAPAGYANPNTPFYYPQPQITSVNPVPYEIYVSPDGSDAPGVVGSITAPFATITNALGYITALPGAVYTTNVICIFVAPGVYAGNFSLLDNMYLIGATVNNTTTPLPSQSPNAVSITDLVTVTAVSTNDPPIVIQNIQLDAGVRVRPVFYDTALNLVNCAVRSQGVGPAIDIDPADSDVVSTLSARNCIISTTETTNLALVRGIDSEKGFVSFDGCQFSTEAEEGSIIELTGTININNCTLANYQTGNNLSPLIIASSGATLVPDVNITNSTLKYADVSTTDTGGNKLAIRFDASAEQNINSSLVNNVMSIFLGDSQTDIIKNVGAGQVTISQSANSCLLDGKSIDTTNIVLTTAHFLQDSPAPPGPGAGVETLNSLSGDITITGDAGISVGAGEGNSIAISNSGVLSLAALTGAVTLSSPDASITIAADSQDIQFTTIPTSLQGLVSSITLASPLSTIGISTMGQTINLEAIFPSTVTSLNSFTGAVTINPGAGISVGTGVSGLIDITNTGILSTIAGAGMSMTGTSTVTFVNEGVTSTIAGSGISVSGNTGSVTISNDGVTSTIAGLGIGVSGNTGSVTISNEGVVSTIAGAGMSITGTSTVTFVNEGVTSTIGGAGISTSGPNGSVTITNEGVTSTIAGTGISVSGNTGSVTIATLAPVYNFSQVTTSTLVNSTVFQSIDLLNMSSLRAAAPIAAWGTALFTDLNSSSGSEIDIALSINGTVGPTQRVSIVKNHHQSFPLMGSGTGPSPGGNFSVSMLASTIVGDVQVTYANAMAFSDMYQTL